MRVQTGFDLNNSIAAKKLVGKKGWLEIINNISILFLLVSLAFGSTLLFWKDIQTSKKLSVLAFICLTVFSLSVYSIYRVLVGSHLSYLHTGYTKSKNKYLLELYLKEKNIPIVCADKNVIIINKERELSWNGLWSKTTIIIVDENDIYFNIKKDYPKLNPPVLLSHIIFKNELKIFFKKNYQS